MALHPGYAQWGCELKCQSLQVLDVQNFDQLKHIIRLVLLQHLVHTAVFEKMGWTKALLAVRLAPTP